MTKKRQETTSGATSSPAPRHEWVAPVDGAERLAKRDFGGGAA